MAATLSDLVYEAKREAGALVADLRVSDIRAAGELHERGIGLGAEIYGEFLSAFNGGLLNASLLWRASNR
ncbi:MAG TPA: hypothetical protein PLP04_13415 [Bryobacteraceae bacterium]|nr:hypothetical protein [Bryobacteraceae bacterium]